MHGRVVLEAQVHRTGATMSAQIAGAAPGTPGRGTIRGATFLRSALGRPSIRIAIALAASVLVVVQDYLSWANGIDVQVPAGPRTFSEWFDVGLRVGVQVGLAVAIAVLVIVGIDFAVLGLVDWRRGVRGMDRSPFECGPTRVALAQSARQDHAMPLFLSLVYVGASIATPIGFAIPNVTLSAAHAGPISTVVVAVATGLATGGVLVLIYS